MAIGGLEESNSLTYYQPFRCTVYSIYSTCTSAREIIVLFHGKKYVIIGDWIRILMSKERKCKKKVETQNKQIILFASK